MVRRIIPILAGYLVTVLFFASVPMLGQKLQSRDPALAVHARGHEAEVRQALVQAGIPDLRIVDLSRPIPNMFLLSALGSAPIVALQLVIFFVVFYTVRKLLKTPTI